MKRKKLWKEVQHQFFKILVPTLGTGHLYFVGKTAKTIEVGNEAHDILRKKYPQYNLWTIGLTGGTIAYIPTAKMIDEGGYEGRSTIVHRNAEKKLRNDIEDLLSEMKS